ncbi:MAG TPA: 2-dehydro-3-deoxygalactonokinase, partial [Bacteroidia bacterium]|nr:2-dehydro-3-deoxygalactonokinase [Bacteroidia bacterium]
AFDRLTLGSLIGGDGTPTDCGSAAFRLGVDRSSGPGGLLHHLFLARSGSIAGEFGQSEVRSFVSGLLVGHEIRAAWPTDSDSQVLLIGDSPAATATAAALQHLDLPHERITEDVHLAGIVQIVDRT